MATATRAFYLLLTAFVFTQLLTVLWPRQHLHQRALAKRALADEVQCDDIWSFPDVDKCTFIRDHCSDYPAGLINYLHFYFCDLEKAPALALLILGIWLMFLFGFVGVAASDFFCPNLNTIAKKLHLSESMTGVTFLAFGNGSPDVFSTFSAIGAGSASLAIGELVGAASFITSVVVGCMAIIKPFRVSKAPFLRDVTFFAGAVIFTLVTVVNGEITVVESSIMISFYILYVIFVVVGNWWHQKNKRERSLEAHARSQFEDETDSNSSDDQEHYANDEHRALLSGESARSKPPRIVTTFASSAPLYTNAERDGLLEQGGYLSATTPESLTHSPGSESPRSLHRLHSHNEGITDAISLRATGAPVVNRRPSLLSAIEFRDVVRSLTLSGSHGRVLPIDTGYYGPVSPASRSRKHSTRSNSSVPPSLHSRSSTTAALHQSSQSPLLGSDHLMPPMSSPGPEQTEFPFGEHATILNHSLMLPTHTDVHHHVHYQDHERHGSATNTLVEEPLEGTLTFSEKWHKTFQQTIKPTYLPTLVGWNEKSHFVKFLAVTSIPMVFLLTLTLPVVEICEDDETLDEGNDDDSVIEPIGVMAQAIKEDEYDGWNRVATTVQMFLAPIFVAAVVASAAQEGYRTILFAALGGAIAASLLFNFSAVDRPPRFYGALCFVGFMVAITWIFLVANEVVGVLQAFGMILHVSDAILGLTIFAMGNSLGDLVANITIARMGFPRMAFSACFGGPMLNLLLGLGISGTYLTMTTGKTIALTMSPTLFVSATGVLLALLVSLVVIPKNNYVMDRRWGWFLVTIYFITTVINVVIEVVSSK